MVQIRQRRPSSRCNFALFFLTLFLLALQSAFAFSALPREQPAGTTGIPDSRRIFVGGLSPSGCDPAALQSAFERYGQVQNVALHGFWHHESNGGADRRVGAKKKARPFAFVTFADAKSAKRALDHHAVRRRSHEPMLYKEVKVANPIKPRQKPAKNKESQREEDAERLAYLTDSANVILQCPKSHLDRLQNYLASGIAVSGQMLQADVLGSLATGRKVKLLFIKAEEPSEVVPQLSRLDWTKIAISKSYLVSTGAVRAASSEEVAKEALKALESLTPTVHGCECVVRVQAFPPNIQNELITAMDRLWDEESLMGIDIRPTSFTHSLSVVQVKENGVDGDGGVYMIGLSQSSTEDSIATHERGSMHSDVNDRDGKNRAFNKIAEAFARYQDDLGGKEASVSRLGARFNDAVALDCGASPGGWTKWLIEEAECRAVYSIDPGALSNNVLRLKGVRHMKMRLEDALPILQRSGNGQVDIWTSDMCLHDMSEQLDWLLRAKETDMLSPNAMFVLTMKCNIGHSKAAYDNQVEEEVKRLEGIAIGVKTLHLFSNRSGERTIMGFVP